MGDLVPLDTYTELNKYARPWLPWNDWNKKQTQIAFIDFFANDKERETKNDYLDVLVVKLCISESKYDL